MCVCVGGGGGRGGDSGVRGWWVRGPGVLRSGGEGRVMGGGGGVEGVGSGEGRGDVEWGRGAG